jgi:hypothetical protein
MFILSSKVYSQNNDTYSLLELKPDTNNGGLDYFRNLTGITNRINVMESGWISLDNGFNYSVFYIKYQVGETYLINVMILTTRRDGAILYHRIWGESDTYDHIIFFQRNNTPYVLIYYLAGTGNYLDFAIYEIANLDSLHVSFNMIFGDQGLHGYIELIGERIIIYIDGKRNILNFKNGMYDLIK